MQALSGSTTNVREVARVGAAWRIGVLSRWSSPTFPRAAARPSLERPVISDQSVATSKRCAAGPADERVCGAVRAHRPGRVRRSDAHRRRTPPTPRPWRVRRARQHRPQPSRRRARSARPERPGQRDSVPGSTGENPAQITARWPAQRVPTRRVKPRSAPVRQFSTSTRPPGRWNQPSWRSSGTQGRR